MSDTIHYLNTELDLKSSDDLTELGATFESNGAFPLHATCCEDGTWLATFEIEETSEIDIALREPATTIPDFLKIIESLNPPLRAVWNRCSKRDFNIGYDCGAERWAFNQGLSSELLGRIAAVGASLSITLYPHRDETSQKTI